MQIPDNQSHISATVLADSIWDGSRITTMELVCPHIIVPQLNKHGLIRQSISSSRAIPLDRRIASIRERMYIPRRFPKNCPGMVPKEHLTGEEAENAKKQWVAAFENAASSALGMKTVHKEIVNRLLEPFCYVTVIATAVNWSNFFKQRIEHAAQDSMQELAICMYEALKNSTPVNTFVHAPYVNDNVSLEKYCSECLDPVICSRGKIDVEKIPEQIYYSVGRAAGASFERQNDTDHTYEKKLATGKRCLEDQHWTPWEHVAVAYGGLPSYDYGPGSQWLSFRGILKNNYTYSIWDEAESWNNWELVAPIVESLKRKRSECQ